MKLLAVVYRSARNFLPRKKKTMDLYGNGGYENKIHNLQSTSVNSAVFKIRHIIYGTKLSVRNQIDSV